MLSSSFFKVNRPIQIPHFGVGQASSANQFSIPVDGAKLVESGVIKEGEPPLVVYDDHWVQFSVNAYNRAPWGRLERKQEVCVVIPVVRHSNDQRSIIFLREKRPNSDGKPIIALAGGLVSDEILEEELLQAAKKELLQETGLNVEISQFKYVGTSMPSPGSTNEQFNYVLADIDSSQVPSELLETGELESDTLGVDGEMIEALYCKSLKVLPTWLSQQQADSSKHIAMAIPAGLGYLSLNQIA